LCIFKSFVISDLLNQYFYLQGNQMIMSRQKLKSTAFEHFKISDDGKHYVCKCLKSNEHNEQGVCGTLISAFAGTGQNAPTRASNLKRHLQRIHPEVAETVEQKDKAATLSDNAKPGTSGVVQSSLSRFVVSNRVTVEMTKEKFQAGIIEMIVKNSIPFSFFSSHAFQSLNGEMARKLGVPLSNESVRNLLLMEAKREKGKLKESLRNKLVFLKMDACTRQRVNYFAINVQFIDPLNPLMEEAIRIYTLAVKDTEAQHKSDYLNKLIRKVLQEYDISLKQVLAVVTDNATNMVSTVAKLNEEDMESEESDDDEDHAEELPEVADELQIHHMRCGAHTLQLAIRDGLKQKHAANLIGKIRQATVTARNPKLDAIVKRRSGKGAILDQVTRWGSTYMMIQRILELKDVLIDIPDVSMTDAQWRQTEELEKLLRVPFLATKNMQKANLTPGEFLKEWRNVIFQLDKIGGLIAVEILQSMRRREQSLLGNDMVLAAIYVDPNYRILLDEQQRERSKNALCEVAIRKRNLDENDKDDEEENDIPDVSTTDESEGPHETGDTEVEAFDFEKHLDEQEDHRVKRQRISRDDSQNPGFKESFLTTLKEVELFDRSSKLTIQQAISKYPALVQEVAAILTGLPTTQVSVERLFSGLKIVKSDLRASLKADVIDAILFLRTNWKNCF
jgi:hypothetical protein